MGLQKWWGMPKTSSMVKYKWCTVKVQAKLEGPFIINAAASFVVICSMTTFKRGNCSRIPFKNGINNLSESYIILVVWSVQGPVIAAGEATEVDKVAQSQVHEFVEGNSPWICKIKSNSCSTRKIFVSNSFINIPFDEAVVTPFGYTFTPVISRSPASSLYREAACKISYVISVVI